MDVSKGTSGIWVYPFLSPREIDAFAPRIAVRQTHIELYDVCKHELETDQIPALIETMQTAQRIQQRLAAGQPVVIHEGQLIELTTKDMIELAWVATYSADKTEEGYWETTASRDDLARLVLFGCVEQIDSISFLITDLGWEVLRVP